jgi:hypothetical protein
LDGKPWNAIENMAIAQNLNPKRDSGKKITPQFENQMQGKKNCSGPPISACERRKKFTKLHYYQFSLVRELVIKASVQIS